MARLPHHVRLTFFEIQIRRFQVTFIAVATFGLLYFHIGDYDEFVAACRTIQGRHNQRVFGSIGISVLVERSIFVQRRTCSRRWFRRFPVAIVGLGIAVHRWLTSIRWQVDRQGLRNGWNTAGIARQGQRRGRRDRLVQHLIVANGPHLASK